MRPESRRQVSWLRRLGMSVGEIKGSATAAPWNRTEELMFSFRVGALVLLISGSAAMAASEEYQVSLGPAARTNATQRIAVGGGAVKVSYDGQQLSIDGTFGGLVSPATDAHLCQGTGIGLVGTCG